ncbi:MAG: hypothetical protein ACE5HS_11345 [bacterium]
MNSELTIDSEIKSVPSNLLVQNIFKRLQAAGIAYCLLRGADELQNTSDFLEIDLLVPKSQLCKLADCVAELGFVPWPAWGHAPHRFFLAFEKSRNNWVKLDVVTDIFFGAPIRKFRVNLAETFLRERVQRDISMLSPAHEFIALLLHGLLDKNQIRAAHRRRLIQLWRQRDEAFERKVESFSQRFLAPAISMAFLEQVLATKDWSAIEAKRRELTIQFRKRDPWSSTWHALYNRLLQRLRPLLFALHQRGLAVALLAPDGAGKSSLAVALTNDLRLKARRVYLGGNVQARTVKLPGSAWLHQHIKSRNGRAASKNPFQIWLKGLNFCNKLLERWLCALVAHYHILRGRIVVFDRYIYDSWLHKKSDSVWKRIRRGLFEGGLPQPELVVLLDAPGDVLFQRKGEHSPAWLEQQRQSYLKLVDKISNMRVVDATQSTESVKSEVTALIWQQYRESHKR